MKISPIASTVAVALALAAPGWAENDDHTAHQHVHPSTGPASGLLAITLGPDGVRADANAPIGVMGDHLHPRGGWMLSYRFMHMEMQGNLDGADGIGATEIATTVPNRFFGMPMQPPTLRVVPKRMSMDMHMFSAMYAPADWVTLMAMGSYIEKEMDHVTFRGPKGTAQLGDFTTDSDGFGDLQLGGLFRLFENEIHHLHLNAGLSVPTGSIHQRGEVLTPMNVRTEVRLPYAMQIGSGTVDALPGLTYTGLYGRLGWGAQYLATIRLGDNRDDYRLGDVHDLTAWGSVLWMPWLSTSLRLLDRIGGSIDGIDDEIVGPVQTADPENYGGQRLDVLLGVNLVGPSGWLRGHRISIEAGVPVYQDLNGPQLETDWTLTVGYQFAF